MKKRKIYPKKKLIWGFSFNPIDVVQYFPHHDYLDYHSYRKIEDLISLTYEDVEEISAFSYGGRLALKMLEYKCFPNIKRLNLINVPLNLEAEKIKEFDHLLASNPARALKRLYLLCGSPEEYNRNSYDSKSLLYWFRELSKPVDIPGNIDINFIKSRQDLVLKNLAKSDEDHEESAIILNDATHWPSSILCNSQFDAEADNYVQHTSIHKFAAQEIAKEIQSQGTVLDLGSGTGLIASFSNRDLHGLDRSFWMLVNNHHNKNKYHGDMNNLPFEDGYFDQIISSLAIHWSDNLARTFEEVARCLKPGGSLNFSIVGTGNLFELQQAFQLDYFYQRLSLFKLKELCLNAGLKITKTRIYIIHYNYPNLRSMFTEFKKTGTTLKSLNSGFIGTARKYKNISIAWEVNFITAIKE